MATITQAAFILASCFWIFDGGAAFYTVRSYLETLRNQSAARMVRSFQGETPQPSME